MGTSVNWREVMLPITDEEEQELTETAEAIHNLPMDIAGIKSLLLQVSNQAKKYHQSYLISLTSEKIREEVAEILAKLVWDSPLNHVYLYDVDGAKQCRKVALQICSLFPQFQFKERD
jgi:hypothetical protein